MFSMKVKTYCPLTLQLHGWCCETGRSRLYTYRQINIWSLHWARGEREKVFESLPDDSHETVQQKQYLLEKLHALQNSFGHYCRQCPVLGFNSSNYDLNIVKTSLLTWVRKNKKMKKHCDEEGERGERMRELDWLIESILGRRRTHPGTLSANYSYIAPPHFCILRRPGRPASKADN